MATQTKQRSATKAQLAHRAQMLTGTAREKAEQINAAAERMQISARGYVAQARLACDVAQDLIARHPTVPGLSDALLQLVDAVRDLAIAAERFGEAR